MDCRILRSQNRSDCSMSRDIFIIDLFGLEMFLPAVIKPYWRIEGVNSKLYAIPMQQLEVNGLLNTRGVEWSASCCGCFTALGTHLAGSWVRLRRSLQERCSCPSRESKLCHPARIQSLDTAFKRCRLPKDLITIKTAKNATRNTNSCNSC